MYQTYYEQEFSSVSSNKISLIGSVQACFTMLLGIPSTVVMYYIGPQMVVLIGSIFCIASFMILSVVKKYWQAFLVQGILFGIGSGLIYIHSTGVLFQYFNKKKALVQGIITGGASIAGVYWPIGIRKLIAKVGFPWANRIIGFIYIPMGIFSVIFLRPRIPPPARKPGENFLRLDFSVLKDWKLWILCMAIFTFMLSLFPGFFYVDLFCERLEVAEYLQEYNVPIVNAIACFARIIPGFIGDYVGRMNINILFLAATGILPLAIWMNARSTGSTLAFCITWAIASGGPVCLTPAIVGQLFPGKELPSCLSLFFAWGGLGGLLGPTIGGSFIPRGHVKGVQGFNHLAIFVGIMAFVSMSCVILVRTWYTRKILYKI